MSMLLWMVNVCPCGILTPTMWLCAALRSIRSLWQGNLHHKSHIQQLLFTQAKLRGPAWPNPLTCQASLPEHLQTAPVSFRTIWKTSDGPWTF